MPTVRRNERSVGINPLTGGRRTAHATAESEGAGVAQARVESSLGLAQFGGTVARTGAALFGSIMDQERAAADQTALLAANNKLSDWKNRRLFDPNKGAFTLKGEAALPLPEDVKAEFEKVSGEIEAGLGTPQQRAAFARLKSQEWQAIDLQVRRHVFGEMQEYRAGELKATVANATNAAIQAATDPKLVAIELQKAVSAIETNAPGLGLGKEQIEQQVAAVRSTTHVGVINQLLSTEKTREAQAYFEAVKGQIAGDKQDEVERALEAGTLRAQSQQKADEIVGAGGTLTEQRDKARAIEDPKLRDEVMQRIEHEASVREREEREREEVTMRSAFDILDRTADVTKIPPAQWASFNGATRSAMRSYAQQRAKGTPIETDLPTYYSLMEKAGNDPAAFAATNLLAFRSKLDDTEFKQLAGLQLSIKSGNRNATEKELAPFRTKEQLVNDTLVLHGIDPKEPDNARAVAQLRRLVDRRVDLLQGEGKKASNQDIQAEIDRLLTVKETVPGSWWNILPGGASFTDTEKRLLDHTIADIPAADRSQIEAALKARGRSINDQVILDIWIEHRLRSKK